LTSKRTPKGDRILLTGVEDSLRGSVFHNFIETMEMGTLNIAEVGVPVGF
jgi:hypothetical protein